MILEGGMEEKTSDAYQCDALGRVSTGSGVRFFKTHKVAHAVTRWKAFTVCVVVTSQGNPNGEEI